MNTVIIVSENQTDFTLFSSNFAHLPVHFSWTQSIDQAIEKIAFEQPFILFMVSKKIEQLLEWLTTYDNSIYQIPLVSFSGNLDWADREMLWKNGVSDIVELPRSRKELEYIIRAFLVQAKGKGIDRENQLQGRLQDLGLVDLIRSFINGEKNGILNLDHGGISGHLEFNNGKLVHAALGECDPLEAVMVMSLWNDGVFYGSYSDSEYKETIHLNNEQIIEEASNYQKAYQDILKKLPNWDVYLYTDPNLEYQEFGPKDRKILQLFRNGQSLEKFMPTYSGSWNFILKKFILWLDRKWILKEDAYRLLQAQIRADERKSAFRKALDKMFSKDQKEEILAQQESEAFTEDPTETEIITLPGLFNQQGMLSEFLDSNRGTLEIPVLIADEQEDSILFDPEQLEQVPDSDNIRQDEIWLTEEKSVIYYCVKGFDSDPLWTEYDALLTKVPFILVLFHQENPQVERTTHNLEARYRTPAYFISSQPVNPTDSIKEDKKLVQIPEEKLVLFDSLSDEKLKQVFTDAIRLHLRLLESEPSPTEEPASNS